MKQLAYSVGFLTAPRDGTTRQLTIGFFLAGLIGSIAGQFWSAPTGSRMAGMFILLGFAIATAVTIWASATTKRR